MGRDEMRAADADRQAVADELKAALEEGRLDLHEYDERLQRAYAAKTYGELHPLLSDLPSAALPVPAPRRPPGAPAVPVVDAPDAVLARRWVFEVWASWVPVVAVTTAIWLISSLGSGGLLYFWPMWVAGPWGAVLIFVTLAGLASGEPRRQAEKRARKEHAKQLKRERKALAAEADTEDDTAPTDRKKDKNPG